MRFSHFCNESLFFSIFHGFEKVNNVCSIFLKQVLVYLEYKTILSSAFIIASQKLHRVNVSNDKTTDKCEQIHGLSDTLPNESKEATLNVNPRNYIRESKQVFINLPPLSVTSRALLLGGRPYSRISSRRLHPAAVKVSTWTADRNGTKTEKCNHLSFLPHRRQ